MKIRVTGAGTFSTLSAAWAAWAEMAAHGVHIDPSESPEDAAARIEAHHWARARSAPKGTEEEQWRDGCRHELARRIEKMRSVAPPIDFRAIVRAELDRRGDGALTALAAAVWAPWGMSSMQDVRSAISRWLKGSRADGARASIPLHALELILGYLCGVVSFPGSAPPASR